MCMKMHLARSLGWPKTRHMAPHLSILTVSCRLGLNALMLSALMLFVSACSRSATVRLAAGDELNTNEFGESTPVIVKFFELRRDGRFRNAAVDALWADPSAVLADDMVRQPDELVVFPGDAEKSFAIARLDPTTAFLGILALYRKTASGQQRSLVIPVEELGDHRLQLAGYGIALAQPPAQPPAEDQPVAE